MMGVNLESMKSAAMRPAIPRGVGGVNAAEERWLTVEPPKIDPRAGQWAG
jgi:hypothetical protein